MTDRFLILRRFQGVLQGLTGCSRLSAIMGHGSKPIVGSPFEASQTVWREQRVHFRFIKDEFRSTELNRVLTSSGETLH